MRDEIRAPASELMMLTQQAALETDLDVLFRENLEALVQRRYGGTRAAAARAFQMHRTTLGKILDGHQGPGDLNAWSQRMRAINEDPLVLFSRAGETVGQRIAAASDQLTPSQQAALLAFVEALGVSTGHNPTVRQIWAIVPSLSEEHQLAVLGVVKGLGTSSTAP